MTVCLFACCLYFVVPFSLCNCGSNGLARKTCASTAQKSTDTRFVVVVVVVVVVFVVITAAVIVVVVLVVAGVVAVLLLLCLAW